MPLVDIKEPTYSILRTLAKLERRSLAAQANRIIEEYPIIAEELAKPAPTPPRQGVSLKGLRE